MPLSLRCWGGGQKRASAGGVAGPLGDVLRWVAVDHVLGHVRDIAAGA